MRRSTRGFALSARRGGSFSASTFCFEPTVADADRGAPPSADEPQPDGWELLDGAAARPSTDGAGAVRGDARPRE